MTNLHGVRNAGRGYADKMGLSCDGRKLHRRKEPVSNVHIGTIALSSGIVHSLGTVEHYRKRRFGDLLPLSAGKKGAYSFELTE